ncbi:hypothetical protein E5H84_24245 [Escherichia coli]|nr:hypothetical protein [Escherichia coli]TGX06046.1 hypothetical protein E5P00_17915 [Escherichia coli]TZC18642.1 hypothetical protein E0K50_22700 [Escherichia coli]TZC32815.1 hypothetical protein E0J34_19160 [Escherichia coli]TZD40900.1 hypothetical protein E0I81_24110 [Escherichia coli]
MSGNIGANPACGPPRWGTHSGAVHFRTVAIQKRSASGVKGGSLEIGKFCTLSVLFNQSRCVTD